jgi:nucleoside-diphosphate-sugar epimerase
MDFFYSDSEFDISKARRVLDWEPQVGLREGIQRTFEAYQRDGWLSR